MNDGKRTTKVLTSLVHTRLNFGLLTRAKEKGMTQPTFGHVNWQNRHCPKSIEDYLWEHFKNDCKDNDNNSAHRNSGRDKSLRIFSHLNQL